jgi:threonine dehydratase
LPVTLLVVPGAPAAKLMQLRCFGARVLELRGLGFEAAGTLAAAEEVVRVATRNNLLPFVTARRFSPEAMDGAKTISYELGERVPEVDVVYLPVGGGGLLASAWQGFLDRASQLDRAPRLVAVQPNGSATVRRALVGAPALLDEPVTTSVSGLQMGALFDTADVVDAMRSSGGHLVEVTGQEVRDAQARLAHAADTLVEPGRGRRARRRDRRRCRRAFRGQRDGGRARHRRRAQGFRCARTSRRRRAAPRGFCSTNSRAPSLGSSRSTSPWPVAVDSRWCYPVPSNQ